MAGDNFVQVPPQSTGQKIATYEKTEGGNTVEVQKVTIAGHSPDDEISPVGGRLPVDGSGVTQPVSAASLPLPSGAATSAKQPALGVAGTPSGDVISIQGETGMTAVKVDGSAVTQPVSGTVGVSGSVDVSDRAARLVGQLTDGAAGITPAKTGQFPTALVGGRLDVNLGAAPATVPVSAASLPLPTGAAQETGGNLAAIKTDVDKIPADPAREGGILTTIDTDLKAAQPRKLQDGAGASVTVGQKVMASSLPVTLASDQPSIPTTPSLAANAAQEVGGNLAALVTALNTLNAAIATLNANIATMQDLLFRDFMETRAANLAQGVSSGMLQ